MADEVLAATPIAPPARKKRKRTRVRTSSDANGKIKLHIEMIPPKAVQPAAPRVIYSGNPADRELARLREKRVGF